MTDAVLEIDRISKSYGTVVALREVSLTARAGELVGLVGGPGAGRTTTVRICAGVLTADSGRVRWRSAPIDPATRRRIGYLPERGGLRPELTPLDQLVHRAQLLGLDATEAQLTAHGWLDRLGLRPRPRQRLDALRPADRLRIALAATLLADPDLLLLDEPFAGLADADADLVTESLRDRAAAGVPVLLTSTDVELAARTCDRIAVLRDGRVVADGTAAELLAAGPRLVAVDVPSATPGWSASVAGCRILDVDGSRTLLELDRDTDDQALLSAAVATGPVREFAQVRRTLAELYGSPGVAGTNGTDAAEPQRDGSRPTEQTR